MRFKVGDYLRCNTHSRNFYQVINTSSHSYSITVINIKGIDRRGDRWMVLEPFGYVHEAYTVVPEIVALASLVLYG